MKRPQGNIGVLIGRERNENTPENQGFAADLLAIANGLGWITMPYHRLNYNARGLILNFLGVLITFVFAFPQESFSAGVGIEIGGQTRIPFEGGGITVDEFNALQRAIGKTHRSMSFLGLSYLLSGFGFQLFNELSRNM